jgi:16S rRNA (guanine527-N7)-methyltransferase
MSPDINNGARTDEPLLLEYFPGLTNDQILQFSKMKELYNSWNEKINVVSRKDINQLFVRHILHSLSIAKLISFVPSTRIIDVGTGGGFPGIPLAVFFPEVEFLLVDSIGKKINVVNEIALELKLNNVKALKSRVEELDGDFDFVLSRAVATISELFFWTKHLVTTGGNNILKNGWIFLKGGDLADEIKSIKRPVSVFEIRNYFKEDFFETKKIVYVSR